jgi:hypothetical protein
MKIGQNFYEGLNFEYEAKYAPLGTWKGNNLQI